MRCIIQRCLSGSVTVNQSIISSVGRGYVVLVGIRREDTIHDVEWLAHKLLNIRLFDSQDKSWDRSVMQMKYDVLLVSQFTLYAHMKGNKPDFHRAMSPETSQPMWNKFVETVRRLYPGGNIQEGQFGGDMRVALVNDGPITIDLTSDDIDFTREIEKAKKTEYYDQIKQQKKAEEAAAKLEALAIKGKENEEKKS